MYILLKSDCAEFGVSNLCFSKVIEEKPWVKEGLKRIADNISNKQRYLLTPNSLFSPHFSHGS